ncbi:MAG: acetate--CoA ligase family protein [Pseudomonadota bacterium]
MRGFSPAVRSTMHIDSLYTIKGLAVVGASPGDYFSDRLFENLAPLGRRLAVFPVSSKRKAAYKIKCCRSVALLKGKCDAAFLLVSGERAVDALEACGENNIGAAVMLAPALDNKEVFERVRKTALKHDIALLGPASLGYVDTHSGLNIFTGRIPVMPLPKGRVSVISESGGLLNEFFRMTHGELRWGIRRALSVGEQAVLTTAGALEQLASDPMTGCIVLLLTGMGSRVQFLSAIEQAALTGKPVVMFPSFLPGTKTIRRPVTARVSVDADVYNDLFVLSAARRGGVFVAGSVAAAAEAAGCMAPGGIERAGEAAAPRWSRIRGRKAALVSVSSGVGGWMKAAALDAGMQVPPFGKGLRGELSKIAPGPDFSNPVDLSGKILSRPDDLRKIVKLLVLRGDCHAVLVSSHAPSGKTPSDMRNEQWLEDMAKVELETKGDAKAAALVPVQVTPGGPPPRRGGWTAACPVMGLDVALALASWARDLEKIDFPEETGRRPDGMDFEAARALLRGPARKLSEPSSRKVLACYGLSGGEWDLADSQSKAAVRARRADGPLRLTLATPDISFEERQALSRAGVKGEAAARKAYVDLMVEAKRRGGGMRVLGVIVEPCVDDLRPVLVTSVSPCDGSSPVFTAGAGDGEPVAAAVCPAGPREAAQAAGLAASASGSKINPAAMAGALRRLSFLASDFRDEISIIRCHVAADGADRAICVNVQVVINKTVS